MCENYGFECISWLYVDGTITLDYRKSSVRMLIVFSWLRMGASNMML